jgi:hypothetical protein
VLDVPPERAGWVGVFTVFLICLLAVGEDSAGCVVDCLIAVEEDPAGCVVDGLIAVEEDTTGCVITVVGAAGVVGVAGPVAADFVAIDRLDLWMGCP